MPACSLPRVSHAIPTDSSQSSLRLPVLIAIGIAAALAATAAVAPVASAYELHLNCAGGPYLAQDGRQFEADRAYASGNAGYVGGWAQGTANWYPIAGTDDRTLYELTRNQMSEYRFDLPSADYLVELLLIENFKHSTNETVFDVLIEGQEVVSNLDIYERVQRDHAINFKLPVTVSDGQLNVAFHADRGVASIAAISVRTRVPDGTPPAMPQGLEATDSYGSVMLRWAANSEDDLAGYRVEFSASAGGPFFPATAPGGDVERVTWRIDPATPGETWFYRVVAIDAFGNESVPSDVVSGTVLAHADSPLPLVEVVIDPDTLEVLNDAPASNDYHAFQLEFDGDPGFLFDGTGRYRGNVMRSVRKKSWKFKMDLGAYDGRETFNLNAEYSDKTLLRQRLSYEIMRRENNHAPLTRYVHLSVNDDWHGVRLDIENVNRDFLRRVGLDDTNATMYRPREDVGMTAQGNLAPLPTVQDYMDIYDKELGDPLDYSDLIQFIENLNFLPSNQKFNWLAGAMNLNRLMDFYSTEVVLQNNDIGFKNYFLHHDLDTGIWTLIPWDVDLTWGNTWPFDETFVTTSSIHLATANRLFQLIALQPILYQLHYDRVRQILVSSLEPGAVAALVDSTYQEVEYEAQRDWWKWGWESNDAFAAGPALMQQFVAERSAFLLQQIAQFEDPSDLCINEVMASNNTTITDEWGDYDDWVEIYNRGTQAVSLLGLHLTDDLTIPSKKALPDTVLQPGERVIVWCDGESYEGPWHAPFQLDVGGEAVGLFTGPLITDPPVDVRVFDAQYTDATYGRLPDGSPYWQFLATPTPGTANVAGGNILPQIRDVAHFPPSPPLDEPVDVTARIFDDGTIAAATLHYDDGGGFTTVAMADDGLSGDGAAGDGVYGATIPGQPAPVTVAYYLSATDDLAATTLEPPAAPDSTFVYEVGYVAPTLHVNEFMAQNNATIADEWGDYDDWVEIYNSGSTAVSLAGMHLTDDLSNPTRFQLPAVSVLPDSFVLVWCDNEPWEGALHAPFALSANGEEIGLFDTVALGVGLIDSVAFGPQLADISMGRVPDGGAWQQMETPTPGASNNQIGITETPAAPAVLRLGGPFPNPFNPQTRLDVELPVRADVRLRIHDVQGRHVRTLVENSLEAGRHRLVWDGRDARGRSLPSGVYWIRLETPGGNRTVRAVLMR